MRMLFQDELITKRLFSRIRKDIKEDQLEKTISDIDYFNKSRKNIITKCDLAFQYNRKNGY